MFFFFLILFADTWNSLDLSQLDIHHQPLVAISDTGQICLVKDRSQLIFPRELGEPIVTGGRGQGPGEFQLIDSLQWSTMDDAFIVYDQLRRSISLWREDGTLVRSLSLEFFGDPEIPPAFPGGSHALFYNASGSEVSLANLETGKVQALFPYSFEKKYTIEIPDGERSMTSSYLWDPTLLLKANGSLVVANFNGQTKLQIFDMANKSSRSVSIKMKRVPTTDEDLDTCLSSMPEQIRKRVGNHVTQPPFWPVFRQILIDSKQQIWLFGQDTSRGIECVVLDSAGNERKRTNLNQLPHAITTDHLYYVENRNDAWMLVRLNLPPNQP